MIDDEKLDEEDDERAKEFMRLCYSPPTKGQMPEGWQILSEIPVMPSKGNFYVEELVGAITAGRGWQVLDQKFTYDLLARQKAWEIANAGNPARVLYVFKKSATKSDIYEQCIFYKKDGKIYIALRVNDEIVLEQEVDGPYDTVGNEPEIRKQVQEECKDVLRGLGYKI